MKLDFDIFFKYGTLDIGLENDFDVKIGLMQPKRAMYYNRSEGCGISQKENNPNSLALITGLRYDIVKWFARRNDLVQGNNKNRILATSQSVIQIANNPTKGELDISVQYIPFSNLKPIKMEL